MNVNVVILPFDKVPKEYKYYDAVGGIVKSKWNKAYEESIHGNLIVDLKDFDVDEGVVYVQDEKNLLCFWTYIECIDLKRTILRKEILPYLVNYF